LPPVHPGRRRCCHSTEKLKPPPPLQPLTVISHLRPSSSSAIDPSSLPVPSSCYRTHQTSPSTTGAQCHRETLPTTGARCRCETPLSRHCKPPRRCPVGPMSLTPPHLARCLLGDPQCSPARPHRRSSTTAPRAISLAGLDRQGEIVGHSAAQHCAPRFFNFSFSFTIPEIQINFKNP
jgi:hypothetical protein